MTDLEQAEARLVELQGWLEAKIATRHSVALRDVLTTAIEVGRLRALAVTDDDHDRVHRALVAAGDELQGQGFKVWPLDATVLDRFTRAACAALAAREEASE